MIKSGNPTQWVHFYPDADLIKSDIDKNACKVIYDEDGIHGVFSVFDGAEPTYKHIEGGNWLNEEPYLLPGIRTTGRKLWRGKKDLYSLT